ncbi:hypothetical protein ACE1CC_27295 [Aerosakkonemataceae cyanobacterium BLCC-F46]|uniref:Uncharacterized protein n=1 Tax=Floridaenema aerugineum BLCC-F46 TaxID=3153654 RepID=A0ABV4XE98_9CYAN
MAAYCASAQDVIKEAIASKTALCAIASLVVKLNQKTIAFLQVKKRRNGTGSFYFKTIPKATF